MDKHLIEDGLWQHVLEGLQQEPYMKRLAIIGGRARHYRQFLLTLGAWQLLVIAGRTWTGVLIALRSSWYHHQKLPSLIERAG